MSWARKEIKTARQQIPRKIETAEQFECARAIFECAEKIAADRHPDIWVSGAASPTEAFKAKRVSPYRTIIIKSRSGKTRILHEPVDGLKLVQHILGCIVHNVLHVIKPYFRPEGRLHGFVRQRSIKSSAERHLNKKYVVKLDIKNYFESITPDILARAIKAGVAAGYQFPCWLQKALETYAFYTPRSYGTNPKTSAALGLPSSPSIANLVSATLIIPPILGTLKNLNIPKEDRSNFTMYADDMTFSSDSGKIVRMTRIVPTLLRRVGLRVNDVKTKVLRQDACQIVCGVVVNKRVGASREYRRAVRKNIHHITKQIKLGLKDPASINVNVLRGQVSYVCGLNAAHGTSLINQLKDLERIL